MSAEYFVVRRSSTALSNRVIHDRDLSLAALGLLMVSLSLPPGAPHGYRAFLGRGLGEKAIRAGLRELEEHGYRFRFRSRKDGQVRVVTVIADEPIDRETARAEIDAMMAGGIVAAGQIGPCISHPDPPTASAEHRAADGAARCEPTVPRSAVARSSAAEPKGSNTSLRSVNTNQPASPADEPDPAGQSAGPGGLAGVDGASPTRQPDQPAETRKPDWGLVGRCLPTPMRTGLTATAADRITSSLRDAIAQGWTPASIRRHLNANALPETARNPTGLVIHRVTELADTPPPAPRHPPPRPSAGSPPAALSPAEIGQTARSLQANASIPPGLRDRLLARLTDHPNEPKGT